MIRVSKSAEVPVSLINTRAYDGEDVKRQLLLDHHDKCYICERIRDTDYEIEHRRSVEHHSGLRQDWNNLFLSCRYCNGKKSQNLDNTLDPLSVNIEDEIEQGIDFGDKKAVFIPKNNTMFHAETVELLNRVFNATGNLRKIKEERFFEYFLSVMNRFQGLLSNYLENATLDNERAIRNELAIDKEFLGFKYWMIKNNVVLEATFGDCIVWNKVL